jgi:hypothetical protein
MTHEEFRIQLSLGTISWERLKTLRLAPELLNASHRKTQIDSWLHHILRDAVKGEGKFNRTEAAKTTGGYDAIRLAEILGWLKRDFPYTKGAGRGKPLLLTPLGKEAFETLESWRYLKRYPKVPIEINYDALIGYYERQA